MTLPWMLECSACGEGREPSGLPTVCDCGAPWLVSYDHLPAVELRHAVAARPATMWRYREWLPLASGEEPVSLGEGMTPLIPLPQIGGRLGLDIYVKDESQNPTGSFKARGMSAAVTRAAAAGAEGFTVPTAGNAGVALAAYAARAGRSARVFAPRDTPPRLLEQARAFGATVEVIDGHIGDCGKASRAYAAESGAFDVSTLREPYRIEGKKTLGLELAEQFGWTLPDSIIYPTGGGTGLIGMWKAFDELRAAGWIDAGARTRLYSVQAAGCAPVVRAFDQGKKATEPWENPVTVASGLRVPAPLGGPLVLRALKDTGGTAVAVEDATLTRWAERLAAEQGIDCSPEGGAALAALELLAANGQLREGERVVVFNTGAGWLYRG